MSDFLKVPPGEPIPLSVLGLDLDEPTNGWAASLAAKGISTVLDDLGRLSVARADARTLFRERAESVARQREITAHNDAKLEGQRLSQLPPGIPWYEVPVGLTAAEAMMASDPDRDKRPRRTSVLEDALAGGETVMHILEPQPAFEDDAS
jgi:hypothetical protein